MLNEIIFSIILIVRLNYNEGCIQVKSNNQNSTKIPQRTTALLSTTVPIPERNSSILTLTEMESLQNRTGLINNLSLLWRGTRDGFSASAFHSKCDGKANTITLIKSTLNYVFGGYTSIPWTSSSEYKEDPSAYLFSLRVNGTSTAIKYPIVYSSYAILHSDSLPIFGGGYDIYISGNSNLNQDSFTRCYSYQCPSGVSFNSLHSKLAGSSYFTVSEIEIFQIM